VARDPGSGEPGVGGASCGLAVGRAVIMGVRPGRRGGDAVQDTGAGTGRVGWTDGDRRPAEAALAELRGGGGTRIRSRPKTGGDAQPPTGKWPYTQAPTVSGVAGHLTGDGWAVQGNMLSNAEVLPRWPRMTMSVLRAGPP